ncbi:helix-hairpin-helix domain-containing protein [Porticoccaceae bacterium]|nr:helix-hairpin-helix domain-containing protein [Porticoccaceae bacterium]MDB3966199.1 helix-hairpin-helix domain-containing protein [Porticoccaceae bacterium]
MGILLKRIVLIITTTIAFSTIVMAASEPTDEMRSLVITADYEPVNINKASAARIAAAMKGVGLKTATAIVAYRKDNGPFKTIDELTEVKGVGAATLRKNQRVIVLE